MQKQREGYAFPNLLFAFRYIPMCLNEADHRLARRRIAEYLAERRGVVTAAIPGIVENRIGILRKDGDVEVMRTIVDPIVKDVLGELNGVQPADRGSVRSASAIFDRMMGLKRRRALDNDLGKIRMLISRTLGATATEDDIGYRLALFVLGYDALAGTIGETLHHLFVANAGKKLSEIVYPAMPLETGVPFVERIAAEFFEHRGVSIAKGDRLRILLQSFQYAPDPADRVRMFGVGLHACLGRQLSLDLWARIAGQLSRIENRVEVLAHAFRTEDYIFTCPDKLLVAVRP